MVLKQDWRRLSVRRRERERERERKENSTMRSAGFKALVQLRNLVIKSIRNGYRSVCYDHPFLVGAILFLVFLYRSCPLLFSLLVSASPVLVCTFALLGTLLSYGNPQIPEIEVDSSEISSARAVRQENNTIFGKDDEPFGAIDRLSEVRREVSDRGIGAVSVLHDVDLVGEPKQVESTVSHSQAPSWQSSREIGFKEELEVEPTSKYKNQEIELGKAIDWRELGYEAVASTNVAVENQHDVHEVQNRNFETDKSVEAPVSGQMEEDNPESSWGQWTWTKVDHDAGVNGDASNVNGGSDDEEDDDDEEEEDESSDSGSDGAESSSPDPSMADITPLLDELYPLLENDNSDLVQQPRQSSDISTDGSQESSESSINSDEESDPKEAEEDAVSGGGGDDDDDDEEEGQQNKEDEAKSAIKWTEDDQKNLMDLGSSEMERNQRLESLIARRRARRDMRIMMERNLIDLEGMDLTPQMAPIITTRHNPFDSPNDSYDYMGLPPIPGSAPSVFSQRQNPFDLPYDSSEEKPDLTGDSFQQEFIELTHKDPLFRRHESFNIGSSNFDFHRHDRTGGRLSRFRPYFIPERIDSDGTGHSPYTRQSSELSESSFRRQLSGSSSFQRQASGFSESSFQRQSSDMSESKASSAGETEPTSLNADEEEMKLNGSNVYQERIPVSETQDVPHLTRHEYRASSILNSVPEEQSEKIHLDAIERYTSEGFHLSQRRQIAEIKLGDSGIDAGEKSWFAASWDLAAFERRQGETHRGLEPAEKKLGSSSSLSSLSEVNEDVTEVDQGVVKEELLEPLDLSPVIQVGLSGRAMSAILEEENSNSISSSASSSSEEDNDSTEEKNVNVSPRSGPVSEEYNDATEEKKSSHSRSSSASSSEEYNDAAEENKSGHSRSSSASSSEVYNDAAEEKKSDHSRSSSASSSEVYNDAAEEKKSGHSRSSSASSSEENNNADGVRVKVDKDLVNEHPGASEHDQKSGSPADEAQDLIIPPRASNFNETSGNPSDWVQEGPAEIQDPVYDLSPQASDKISVALSEFHLVEETDHKVEVRVNDYDDVELAYDLQHDDQHLESAELIVSETMERDSTDVKEHVSIEATLCSPEMLSREVVQELASETMSKMHSDTIELALPDKIERDSKDVKEHVSSEATFSLPEVSDSSKVSSEVDLVQELTPPDTVNQMHLDSAKPTSSDIVEQDSNNVSREAKFSLPDTAELPQISREVDLVQTLALETVSQKHLDSAEPTLSDTVQQDPKDVNDHVSSEGTFSLPEMSDSSQLPSEVDLVQDSAPEAFSQKHLDLAELILSDTQDFQDMKKHVSRELAFSLPDTVELPKISREVDLVQELAPEIVSQKLVSASNEENYTAETEHDSQDRGPNKDQPNTTGEFEEMIYEENLKKDVHDEVSALSEPSAQSTQTGTPDEDIEQSSITGVSDVSEPVHETSEVTLVNPKDDTADCLSEPGESIASDNTIDDMKGMDEAILSELDAVGDFSMGPANLGPNMDITSDDVKTQQDPPQE